MILVHNFIGKSDIDTDVSAEEILFLFCITQSYPVASGDFLIDNLNLTAKSSEGLIHMGGIVTHIAFSLGLDRKLVHLNYYCGYTLMDVTFCLDRGLMRINSFNPNQHKLLINHETVNYFTLPYPTKTNVHDIANWTYALEGQDETLDVPRSPPIPEYHPLPPSNRTTLLSNNFDLHIHDIHIVLIKLRREVAILRQEVIDLTLQLEVSDAPHTTESDCLY